MEPANSIGSLFLKRSSVCLPNSAHVSVSLAVRWLFEAKTNESFDLRQIRIASPKRSALLQVVTCFENNIFAVFAAYAVRERKSNASRRYKSLIVSIINQVTHFVGSDCRRLSLLGEVWDHFKWIQIFLIFLSLKNLLDQAIACEAFEQLWSRTNPNYSALKTLSSQLEALFQ